jgi:hypothetical protein
MLELDQAYLFVALTPVWPALAALLVAMLLLPRQRPAERLVFWVTQVALWLSLAWGRSRGWR